MKKSRFLGVDSSEDMDVYVLEETVIGGIKYLLVTEEEEGDSVAYILKEVQSDEDEIRFEVLDDDEELEAISKVFQELLDDVDMEM